MHGDPHGPLERSANVVAVPRHALGNIRVYSTCNEEAGKILDAVISNNGKEQKSQYSKSFQLALPDTAVTSCETNPSRLNPIMYMPRFPWRSARKPPPRVKIHAAAYGGTDMSWAFSLV